MEMGVTACLHLSLGSFLHESFVTQDPNMEAALTYVLKTFAFREYEAQIRFGSVNTARWINR